MATLRTVERALPVALLVIAAALVVAAVGFGSTASGFVESPAVTAYAHAMPNQGWAPLTVHYSAFGSTGPAGEALRFEWDLDGDGTFETDATATGGYTQRTYVRPATTTVTVRVTTATGVGATAATTIEVRHPGSSTVDYWTHFDDRTVGRIDLLVTTDNWNLIWNLAPSKTEIEAGAIIFGTRIERIGLSMKGNGSLDASGPKKSWKLDLNEFVERQDFGNLSMLLLHNNFGDPSMLREKLAYDMLQFAGANSGFTRFVEVWVDVIDDDDPPTFWGISTLVERPDRSYLANRFGRGNDDGNLYKADAWFEEGAADLASYGPDIQDYPKPRGRIAYRAVPDETVIDHADIIRLTSIVDGNQSTPEAWAGEVETILNVDSFLRYLAATFVHLNLDTYPYTGNNYYLYHHPGTDLFEWIAWDENSSWGLFGGGAEFPLFGSTESLGPLQRAPLFQKVFTVDAYRITYAAYVDLLLRHWFNREEFTARATGFHDLIRPYVVRGDLAYTGPSALYTLDDFDNELDRLIDMTAQRHDYLRAALSRIGGTNDP